MSSPTTLSTVARLCFLTEDLQHSDQTNSLISSVTKSDKTNKIGAHSLLQKLFYRQPTRPKLVSRGSEDQLIWPRFGGDNNPAHMDFEVLPCPYIRPLGNRLEPRIENAHPALGRQFFSFTRPVSCKNTEGFRVPRICTSLDELSVSSHDITSTLTITNRHFVMSGEEVALAAAADDNSLLRWKYYLKCYSEGRYNLTVPPCPPPKNPKLIFLPSTYPPNELERLNAFQASPMWSGRDVVWTGLEIERARSLIMAATTKFELPSAAISFFDRDFEIVQAERGYSRHLIPRHESIASHVLLTDDVMTISDTRKDWRFLGNPLVVGSPKIRFFAGAPILSLNGQSIGVFAIFGPESRSSFSPKERCYLTSLSEVAARELIPPRHAFSNINRHDRPRSGQVSYDNKIIYRTSSSSTLSSIEIENSESASVSLRYHKKSRNAIGRSRVIIKSEAEYTPLQNQEIPPQSSDNSETFDSPTTAQSRGTVTVDEDLSTATLPKISLDGGTNLDSHTCGTLSSKICSIHHSVFMDPEIDSLELVPRRFEVESNGTCDNIRSLVEARTLSDTFLSNDAPVLLASDLESSTEIFSDVSSFSLDSVQIQTLLEESPLIDEKNDLSFTDDKQGRSPLAANELKHPVVNSKPEAASRQINRHMKIAFAFDSISPSIFESIDVQAEAKFAAELWANNLAFDVLYALELIEMHNPTRQVEQQRFGNIETRILVAYGLPNPINFDIPIHLKVLSGYGAITWENKKAMPEEYSRGFMMPLPFEPGVLDSRSYGVVFGAFRRKPDGIKRLPKLKVTEVERLQRAAAVLMEILCRAPWLKRSGQEEQEQHPITSGGPAVTKRLSIQGFPSSNNGG